MVLGDVVEMSHPRLPMGTKTPIFVMCAPVLEKFRALDVTRVFPLGLELTDYRREGKRRMLRRSAPSGRPAIATDICRAV
jgi:hypothetical protein